MLKFEYKRSIFSVCEMAFGTFRDVLAAKSDVVYMHSSDTECLAFDKNGIVIQRQYTLVNSLLGEESDLLSKFKKTCKYEIRRSEKEGTQTRVFDCKELLKSITVLDRFQNTYNSMFQAKGLSNRFNRGLVEAGLKYGNLLVSICVAATDPECTVFHAYLIDGVNTVLMYSASPLLMNNTDQDRMNLLGRMNKYLHWRDMLWFKNHQYQRYEWGGISSCDNPNGIDRFKMEFGGEVCSYYNYIVARTPLGHIYTYSVKKRSNAFDKSIN